MATSYYYTMLYYTTDTRNAKSRIFKILFDCVSLLVFQAGLV